MEKIRKQQRYDFPEYMFPLLFWTGNGLRCYDSEDEIASSTMSWDTAMVAKNNSNAAEFCREKANCSHPRLS